MITSENSIEQLGFSDAGLTSVSSASTARAWCGATTSWEIAGRRTVAAARAGPRAVHRGGAVHEQLHGGAALRRRRGQPASRWTLIDYVLTLRMRPVKVKLRLLAGKGQTMRYVLVERPS
jgi:hypothetical protein